MNYAAILVFILTLCASGIGGYYVGRYQGSLIDKIRTLEQQGRKPEPEKPVVLMGESYQPPRQVSTAPDTKRVAGLVETKTPERLDWETTQAIENESRGHVQIGPT